MAAFLRREKSTHWGGLDLADQVWIEQDWEDKLWGVGFKYGGSRLSFGLNHKSRYGRK